MSIREGVCDWCGRERLLETGDERSKVQGNKLWCGTCRGGSAARYQHSSDDWLRGQIKIAEEMLEQHPLRWEEPYDHIRMHLFKLDYHDEIWRMKRELEMREADAKDSQ